MNVQQLLPAWQAFHAATDIGPIRDEVHYGRMVDDLNGLLAMVAGDESHPAMGLIDIIGDLIEDYESAHHPMPEVSGVDALKFLMEQHNINQSDLPEIGSQGVVSEVLAGKRELNVRHVRALSVRFGVSPATFL